MSNINILVYESIGNMSDAELHQLAHGGRGLIKGAMSGLAAGAAGVAGSTLYQSEKYHNDRNKKQELKDYNANKHNKNYIANKKFDHVRQASNAISKTAAISGLAGAGLSLYSTHKKRKAAKIELARREALRNNNHNSNNHNNHNNYNNYHDSNNY